MSRYINMWCVYVCVCFCACACACACGSVCGRRNLVVLCIACW